MKVIKRSDPHMVPVEAVPVGGQFTLHDKLWVRTQSRGGRVDAVDLAEGTLERLRHHTKVVPGGPVVKGRDLDSMAEGDVFTFKDLPKRPNTYMRVRGLDPASDGSVRLVCLEAGTVISAHPRCAVIPFECELTQTS